MQLLFLYSNSITQIYELYHSNIRTPSLNAKSNPLPTHLTQSCLRLCRAHCLDFPIVSVCRDATEAPVGKVTVAKDRPIIYSGPRRPQKGPISWRNTRFRPRRPQKGPISWTNGPIEDCFATGRWHWSACGRGLVTRVSIEDGLATHRCPEVPVGRVAVPKTGRSIDQRPV